MGKGQRRLLLRIHRLVPASQVPQIRQFRLAVEPGSCRARCTNCIHEQWAIGQKKRRSRQHVVDRLQEFRKLCAQIPSVCGPFPNASASELPLLVANKHRSFDKGPGRNHVRIVHLESRHL